MCKKSCMESSWWNVLVKKKKKKKKKWKWSLGDGLTFEAWTWSRLTGACNKEKKKIISIWL